MPTDADRFLEAEQQALDLVESLERLKQSADVYSEVSGQLGTAKDHLVLLIDSFQDIASNTAEAVTQIRSIGGPEILEWLKLLIDKSQNILDWQDEALSQIQGPEILEQVAALDREMRHAFIAQNATVARIQPDIAKQLEIMEENDLKDRHWRSEALTSTNARLDRLITLLYVALGLSGIGILVGIIS